MAETAAARPDSKRRVRMKWVERQVRGSLSRIEGRDGLRVVTERMIEYYVAGTLLGEVSEGFGDVVLRAQAIAKRTHALHGRAHPRSPSDDVEAGSAAGMSQWGARAFARSGFNHRQILAPFHQRTRTEPLSWLTARVAGTSVLAASGGALGASL